MPGTLTIDQNGNLFGATVGGGSIGCGIIFEVKADGRERMVHDFAGPPKDGCTAYGPMIEVANDTFYGTAGGGKDSDGTIFELARDGTVTLLRSFKRGREGYGPGDIVMDPSGNLYGTTGGGDDGYGGVFEFTPQRIYHVLYSFKGAPNDGSGPIGVIRNASGDLFGTTFVGGKPGCNGNLGCGVAFEVAPDGSETVLHFFSEKHADGFNPPAGVIEDGAGNLFGTTLNGGGYCPYDPAYGCGTVFELAPDGTETILYSFSKNDAKNGALPQAGLVGDGTGHYYGTASEGGAYGYGTVFEITPRARHARPAGIYGVERQHRQR
ncbi:MAG: choice-of-anchor tandem repeat GloVer-containing protein [Rhizomicrobium sp.]